FLNRQEKVIFENEFIDVNVLRQASQNRENIFVPTLPVIEKLQDKLSQKHLLQSLQIPTSRFKKIHSIQNILSELQEFQKACVLKWSRQGYDGKGVLILDAIDSRTENQILSFCEEGVQRGAEIYAEEKIDFVQELAIIAVRSVTGDFIHYPLVLSEQKNGICEIVKGPATRLGTPSILEQQAAEYAKCLAQSLHLVGAFALELFQEGSGALLVNEIAPRVHNSGHYTQDVGNASQFENHWRGVLGLPLIEPQIKTFFAMYNLLGPASHDQVVSKAALPPVDASLYLHWYDKSRLKPLRKMGHLNGVVNQSAELDLLLNQMKRWESEWFQNIRK
ncbi:MAG: ATP-grasp domain-containing protein, partial [Deltaproteobacteria bacterium]|nr:ATP-grasp domain-containing protein [Deltaproteobacteria bacterium]